MTDAGTARRPKGRTLAEFGKLSAAEQELLDCAAAGEIAEFGGVRPESGTDANTVRGAFIRFLALGGDEEAPLHEKGVCLQGAWITETLDLHGVESRGGLLLANSVFENAPVFIDARIKGSLILSGSRVPGIEGDGLICDARLFLKNKFVATGEVRLLVAKIGDDLECSDGTFKNEDGYALYADAVNVGGSVLLGNEFAATGTVRLLGAKIGGDLVLRGGLLGSKEEAVDIEGASVNGALMINGVTIKAGMISLIGAKVATLVDDAKSWDKGVNLDGFVYGAFGGKAPTDAKMRIGWLDKQPGAHSGKDGNGSTFRPQPWQQLRKVLREMGHYEAAREVGIAFERRKRECGLIGQVPEISVGQALRAVGGWVYGKTARLLHWGYGALVGYGYRPLRLLMIAAIVWVVCAGAYFAASRWEGAFVPSTQSLFSQYGGTCGVPAHIRWTDCKAIRFEYPQFYPLVYSLNVLLPVGNLGQEATWRPETATLGGLLAQCAVWFETLFGWVASLVLVAVVSGLAKRDE